MCVCVCFFFSLPCLRLNWRPSLVRAAFLSSPLPISFFTEREDWIKLQLTVVLRGLGA